MCRLIILWTSFQDVDRAMARARCQNTLDRLDWLEDTQDLKETINEASEEMLEGMLRNNRGTVSPTKREYDGRHLSILFF